MKIRFELSQALYGRVVIPEGERVDAGHNI
jgi:hypothetical protein